MPLDAADDDDDENRNEGDDDDDVDDDYGCDTMVTGSMRVQV